MPGTPCLRDGKPCRNHNYTPGFCDSCQADAIGYYDAEWTPEEMAQGWRTVHLTDAEMLRDYKRRMGAF